MFRFSCIINVELKGLIAMHKMVLWIGGTGCVGREI